MITNRFVPLTGKRSALAPLALGLLLAAGCDDDSSTDGSSDSTSTGTIATTSGSSTSTTAEPASTGGASTSTSGSTAAMDDSSSGGGSSSDTDGSGSSDSSTGEAGLEIAGMWVEQFGDGSSVEHNISERSWEQLSSFGDALFHVDGYDNAARWVVAQGDANNQFFPELYSKFNWTWDGDELWYCTAVFDAETAADAEAAPDADPGDLMAGCGGFGWSRLDPA